MPAPLSRRNFLAGALLAPAASLLGCGGGTSNTNAGPTTRSASYTWTTTLLTAISIVETAIYDAWACYDAIALGSRLGGSLRRPAAERTLANKQKAISFAAYSTLFDLFPSVKTDLDAAMVAMGYNPSDLSSDVTTPQGIGNTVAQTLLTFRHADGSNQLNAYADTTGYIPVNTPDLVTDPSKWQQLRFDNGLSPAYIAPHWGNVIPFALPSPSAVRPPPPPTYGSTTYHAQAQDVVDLTANLNDQRKVIAEYWADGPRSVLPPGHWQIFGQFVSQRDRHTLDQDVKMFFMLGNAVMDSGIACWECKRVFNTSRPFTAIRSLFAGQQIPSFGGPAVGIQTWMARRGSRTSLATSSRLPSRSILPVIAPSARQPRRSSNGSPGATALAASPHWRRASPSSRRTSLHSP